MNASDVFKTDRLVIRFCRSRENRAESDVVRTFALRRARLLQAVCGFADQNFAACFLSHDLDQVIILADVHSFDRHAPRDFSVIVHDQWRGRFRCQFM